MADVAQLAGVSHQTVSRVLNDHPNVRPDTREKVLDAIRQLAYRPNAAARALVTRRTHTLGVIGIDSPLYGPAMMLNGIERAAQHGYFVVIASLPALDRRSMLDTVDRFLGHAVEGIIVIAPQTSAVAALSHVPADLPLIAVGCETRAPLTSVAVDNADGAGRATGTSSAWGTRPSTTWPGPAAGWTPGSGSTAGARRCARRARASRRSSRATGRRAPAIEVGQELARMDDVTAVFCGNDNDGARPDAGPDRDTVAGCPDDVSVVGFDDVPEAGYFLPPLTTVRQDFGELGRRALSSLVERISGGGVRRPRAGAPRARPGERRRHRPAPG